jgi:hypothetical protein
MICRFLYTSVHQSNSTLIIPSPMELTLRIERIHGEPLIQRSIGNVTRSSISSGLSHSFSAKIVTVGRLRSGNTSTGSFVRVKPHQNSKTAYIMSIRNRFFRQNLMIVFSIYSVFKNKFQDTTFSSLYGDLLTLPA